MGARIEITTTLGPAQALFDRMKALATDMRPAMAAIGGAVQTSTQLRFDTGTSPAGVPWAPLSPTWTIPERERLGYVPIVILVRQGDLRNSITFQSDATSALVGSGLEKAGLHQFGGSVTMPAHQRVQRFRKARQGAGRTKDGRRVGSTWRFANQRAKSAGVAEQRVNVPARTITVPARPFLGLSEDDRVEIGGILERYFLGGLEAIG